MAKPWVGAHRATTDGLCWSVELQRAKLESLSSDSQTPAYDCVQLGRRNENLEDLLAWGSLRSLRVPVHMETDEKQQLQSFSEPCLFCSVSTVLWVTFAGAWL